LFRKACSIFARDRPCRGILVSALADGWSELEDDDDGGAIRQEKEHENSLYTPT
jgi:hypothetical protein